MRSGFQPSLTSTTLMDMKKLKTSIATAFSIILISLALTSCQSYASESAGKGEGGGLYIKLDAFTVNLQGLSQYLQVSITLMAANPHVGVDVKANMPVIRHELILLLSSKEASQISTFEGKQALLQEVKHAVNKVIHLTDKQGIANTLFESFIIQ